MGLKKWVGSAIVSLGALLSLNSAGAQERKLTIDFGDPTINFDVNSNTWYALDQLTGKGSDLLYDNWRRTFLARTSALAVDNYFTHLFKFLSHELGHDEAVRRYGGVSASFKFKDPIFLNEGYKRKLKYEPSLEQDLEIAVGGLNHDEYNSYLTFKNNTEFISVHDGVSFLWNKVYDLGYAKYGYPLEEGGDPEIYIYLLNEQGIELSKGDYINQAKLADMLSMQTWDSFEAIANYIFRGELNKKTTKFYIKGKFITPPIINHYLTTKGSFYNITSIIDTKGKNPVELSFATPVNFIGDGEVKNYRAGGQVNNLRLGEYKFSPFYYVDTDLSFNHTGYSTGLQVNKQLKGNVDLRFKVEHNNNDLLENVVKGEDEGWNFVVGIDVKF